MNSEQAGIIEGNESQAMAASKADTKRGLYRKYDVRKVTRHMVSDGEEVESLVPVTEPCFVLKAGDPFAPLALEAYAAACVRDYPQLATDLIYMARQWREDQK